MFKAAPVGIPFSRRGHNFSHRFVALREQHLVSCLNLFNQVGKLYVPNIRND